MTNIIAASNRICMLRSLDAGEPRCCICANCEWWVSDWAMGVGPYRDKAVDWGDCAIVAATKETKKLRSQKENVSRGSGLASSTTPLGAMLGSIGGGLSLWSLSND